MKIKMQLISDAIFGSGISVPGGEDISVLCDKDGFPYYKGGTFKGVFREELHKYLSWTVPDAVWAEQVEDRLLGLGGDSETQHPTKLTFSDFTLSETVKNMIRKEPGNNLPEVVTELLTNVRTLTSITENGLVKEGSLRSLRCVNKGLYFYSEIICSKEDEPLIKEVLSGIKWVGSMRNRGFGKVKISAEE